ncbi:MAG: division/cell wall cluster transcriptional repressor MraZ [Oscillospiraceae bacterium]|jgi:MraZ protein|nr:division/cell wall cluster transcriptional repressor MraZ [Oscillospiraceae bacterium]
MAGLFGEYRHTIDAKGRLSMPSRLLKALGDPFYVSVSDDRCLNVYALAQWEKLEEEKFGGLSGAEERKSRRDFYSMAQECVLDSQGRVLLNQKLRSYAALDKNVIIAGAGKYAEIWDAAAWDETE